MTVFEDQCRSMLQSNKTIGVFNEAQTDTYGDCVELSFQMLARCNNVAEALIACISLIRASIGLMASMGFTPEQMQEQWELVDEMAPAVIEHSCTTIVEALMLNQGVVNVGRP